MPRTEHLWGNCPTSARRNHRLLGYVDKSQALVVRAIEAGLQESAAERTGRVVKMAVSLPKEAPAIYVSQQDPRWNTANPWVYELRSGESHKNPSQANMLVGRVYAYLTQRLLSFAHRKIARIVGPAAMPSPSSQRFIWYSIDGRGCGVPGAGIQSVVCHWIQAS